MKAEVEKNLHLLEYLHILPIDTMGIPRYVPKLESKHGDIEDPNLIYRVNDQIYVHIYPNKNDVRNFYIPIEPILLTGVGFLIKELEIKLVDHLTGIQFDPENLEEKERILRESLDAICIIGKKIRLPVLPQGGLNQGSKNWGGHVFSHQRKILIKIIYT